MIKRAKIHDWQIIGLYTGKIIVGFGGAMAIPLAVGLFFREWAAVLDFVIGIAVAMAFGNGLQLLCRTKREMDWAHGLATAAFSWLAAMVIGAVPLYLSGRFGSFSDACFEVMSGLTTTGLILIQDLDHASNALNMWRHLVAYIGGQGIIVVALTFLIRGTSGAFMMYVGEGKDEKLLPNVIQTARAIWLVSLTYLAVGTIFLTAANLFEGMQPARSFLHGMWIFMGSWSTCGFAPQSYNALYYHSLLIESLTMIFFTAGSFNFALHWAVWSGDRREIYRNLEILTFVTTVLLTTSLATYALLKNDVYSGVIPLFRTAFYQILSGHTGTGLTTMYSGQFVHQWGTPAMLALIIAMALGGSAASTAGGFKAMRVGIIWKGFVEEVRRLMLPESAVLVNRIHHIKNRFISAAQLHSATTIVFSYIMIYLWGGVLGSFYGYSFLDSLFESVSAGATVGFSTGITSPSMPGLLKYYYIFVMWIGRLEFMAVLAMTGFLIRAARGK